MSDSAAVFLILAVFSAALRALGWSWLWALSPLWIPVAAWLTAVVVTFGVVFLLKD